MDDHLTKPIQPQRLSEVIRRWVEKQDLTQPEVLSMEPVDEEEVLDITGFLERLGGNGSIFRKSLSMFLSDAPDQIERIRQHLKDEDLAGVQLRAHSLKGVAMSIGGKAMQEVASDLEAAARDRERDRAWALIPQLQEEFERLKHSIASVQQPS